MGDYICLNRKNVKDLFIICKLNFYSDSVVSNSEGEDPYNNSEDNKSTSKLKSYAINGKVVLGIGIILAAAAGSTILAMNLSTSPQIHLSQIRSILGKSPSAVNEAPQTTSSLHIDKEMILVQKDFGWNGTFGGPPIVVAKGDVVRITVKNAGHMAHNFGIGKLSEKTMTILNQISNMSLPQRVNHVPYDVMAAIPCPECQPLFEGGHIKQFMQPDSQQVTTFTANETGNFKYFCMVRGHLWLGMIGDLIVQDTNNPTTTAKTIPEGQKVGGA